MNVPFTAAMPALGSPPAHYHSMKDNMPARGCGDAIKLMLEDFGLELERFRRLASVAGGKSFALRSQEKGGPGWEALYKSV